MARPAATYRGARRNAARADLTQMPRFTVVKERGISGSSRTRIVPLPTPKYSPYLCKPTRFKLMLGADGKPTGWQPIFRKQPQVYPWGAPSRKARAWSRIRRRMPSAL